MRIALGPVDPAGTASALAAGLRDRGHAAETVLRAPSPFAYPYTRRFGSHRERLAFALAAPRRYDVLHTFAGASWFGYLDLALAAPGRALAVVQFNGSDCRTSDIANALHPARARIVDPRLDRRIRVIRRVSGATARAAVVQDLELVDYLRSTHRRIYVTPLAIHLDAVDAAAAAAREGIAGEGPLRVLHAPSNRVVKGSDAIERAVAAAGRETPIDFQVVEGRSHADVLAAIARADLVVDQFNCETPGVLAMEAMALGKPVLCEFAESKLASFARPSPAIAITSEQSLTRELIALSGDPGRRREVGQRGAAYARSLHAPDRAADAALAVYRHARDADPGVYESDGTAIRRVD